MDKKEIVLSCAHESYNLDCMESQPTEYFIHLIPDFKSRSYVHIHVGQANKKIILRVDSHQEHSECVVTVIMKSEKDAHHTVEIYQDHTAFHTTSTCTIKGIVYDASSITYTGLITLQKDSINAQAEQKSKFLIMSKNASVKSIPSLQVHHNQVQCGHATTISYIDPVVMWYANQRGITSKIVEQIIEDNFLK